MLFVAQYWSRDDNTVKESVMTDLNLEGVFLEVRDGIAFITINRPGVHNAMTSRMFDQMSDTLRKVDSDNRVRVVLIQGMGKSFMAGGDVKSFLENLAMTPEQRSNDMKTRAERAGRISVDIANLSRPVIVAARGYSVGAGLSIVAAADLAIVSDNAQFILAHVKLGMSPDGGASYFLPRQMGLKRSAEIAMLGSPISASEAQSMGLVNWVVPDAELEQRAKQLAIRIAAAPATAVIEIKKLLRASFDRELSEQVDAEIESMKKCACTLNFVEGLIAVRDKREPRFNASGD